MPFELGTVDGQITLVYLFAAVAFVGAIIAIIKMK